MSVIFEKLTLSPETVVLFDIRIVRPRSRVLEPRVTTKPSTPTTTMTNALISPACRADRDADHGCQGHVHPVLTGEDGDDGSGDAHDGGDGQVELSDDQRHQGG